MDYAQVLLSMGDLHPAQNPVVELLSEELKFSWDLPEANSPESLDQVMVLAYGTETGRMQRILYGPLRREGAAILPLGDLKKEPLETYISFVSADRLRIANSTYLGRVEPA